MPYLKNVRIPCGLVDCSGDTFPVLDPVINPVVEVTLHIEDGLIAAILPASETRGLVGEDCGGRLLTPRFLDAHVHLDKAHTWNRAPNRSGTFAEAIRVLSADKENWTEEDLWHRADYTLACAFAYGTTAVRTHIDTGLPWAETSHRVMAALREKWRDRIELQTVSLSGVDQYAGPDGAELAAMPIRHGATALGGMPLMNPDLPAQLDALLGYAAAHGVGIDLHVDESGDPQAQTLLAVADAVIRNRFPYPVACGHCCSLAVQPPGTRDTILKRCLDAGIHIISLPLCNAYLQDRATTESPKTSTNRTPFWRGLTLLQEWQDQGTVIACASDNVRDAFYAYGDLDMYEVFVSAVRLGHLDYNLAQAPACVFSGPAKIMGLDKTHGRIAPGRPARFIRWASRSFSEWLSRPGQARELFEYENWIQPQLPDPAQLTF